MEKVFEIYIRTTPERLWEAITDSETRSKYQFGMRIKSDWTAGSRFEMTNPGARRAPGRGRESGGRPPRRLVQTMVALWGDDVKSEGTSRITWEIEPVGDSCRLLVTHDQLRDGRQRPALRRLAHDPLRSEDLAGDGGAPHHPGLADVQLRQTAVARVVRPAARAYDLVRGRRRRGAGRPAGRVVGPAGWPDPTRRGGRHPL